mmetsp:Transcript_177389/g.568824  ORF Transcript_177389/g.568824 Transcript_177389/m.568824 type:complete len:249 (+) Transcript_177389:233-979(+)
MAAAAASPSPWRQDEAQAPEVAGWPPPWRPGPAAAASPPRRPGRERWRQEQRRGPSGPRGRASGPVASSSVLAGYRPHWRPRQAARSGPATRWVTLPAAAAASPAAHPWARRGWSRRRGGRLPTATRPALERPRSVMLAATGVAAAAARHPRPLCPSSASARAWAGRRPSTAAPRCPVRAPARRWPAKQWATERPASGSGPGPTAATPAGPWPRSCWVGSARVCSSAPRRSRAPASASWRPAGPRARH